MMKRVISGIAWCAAIYFVLCLLIGAITGVIAGVIDPANALKAGHEAAIRTVSSVRVYIIAGAVALSAIGTWAGILPGTGEKDN